MLVAGNVDVDNATGVDVRREEDGGEFNLNKRIAVSMSASRKWNMSLFLAYHDTIRDG